MRLASSSEAMVNPVPGWPSSSELRLEDTMATRYVRPRSNAGASLGYVTLAPWIVVDQFSPEPVTVTVALVAARGRSQRITGCTPRSFVCRGAINTG
jgi:hypothetical protein